MGLTRLSSLKDNFLNGMFGRKGAAFFWDARFLPRWLPVLLSVPLALVSALLIIREQYYIALPLAFLVPAIMLFIKYPFGAVLIWLCLFPFFLRQPSAAGELMYWVLHRALIPLALAIAVLSSWLGVRKKQGVHFGRVELFMLFFVMLGVINIVLLSQNTQRSLTSFYDRLVVPFCAYMLIRLTAPKMRDYRRLAPLAFGLLIFECAIGLLSWFAPEVLPPHWLGLAGARTVGTFGNAAVYTTTLLFLALFLLQHNMQARPAPLTRALYWIGIGLAMFMVFFSFSRGSWLGGAVVLLGWLILYARPILRMVTVVLLLVIILGSSVLAQQVSFAIERLNTVETAESRLVQDAASLRMIEARPLWGWGYDNYLRFNREFVGRVGDSVAVESGSTTTSHNTYLTLAVEFGLLGIFFYMIGVVCWLWFTLRVWRRMPADGFMGRKLVMLLWLLLIDHFIVSNFMDMVKYNLFGTTVWWITLGLIANLVYPYLKSNEISAVAQADRHTRRLGAPSAARR